MRVGSQAERVLSSQTARVHARDGGRVNKLPVMLHNQDRYATAAECFQCASGVDIKDVSLGRSRGNIALTSTKRNRCWKYY